MGIFDTIKSTFNLGGITIAVSLTDEVCRLGTPVTGQICLKGGEYPQSPNGLRIGLEEFWRESQGTGKQRHEVPVIREEASSMLASHLQVEPGVELALPFSLALPRHARLSQENRQHGWRLRVEMDLPGAVDPFLVQTLVVGPSPEIEVLIGILTRDLKWTEVPGRRHWDQETRVFALFLQPLPELEKDFDDLTIFCTETPGGWDMGFEFDLQEKSLGDWFRSLVFMDQVTRRMEVTLADLDPRNPEANAAFGVRLAAVMKELSAR
jgi:sporulation-control protein spo0M